MTEHHLGCDLSKWQGATGAPATLFDALDGLGVEFGVFRASIGTQTDASLGPNRQRGKARGWVTGGYHFLYRDSSVDVGAQAKTFVDQLKATGGLSDCLAVVDVEWIAGDADPRWADVQAFVRAFRALAPGHPLGVYTAGGYWRSLVGNANGAAVFDFLWDARWVSGLTKDTLPAEAPTGGYGGWGRTPLWQWGSLHTAGKTIDGNAWYGSLAALRALSAPSKPAPAPAPAPAPTSSEDDMLIEFDPKRLATLKAGASLSETPGGPAVATVAGGERYAPGYDRSLKYVMVASDYGAQAGKSRGYWTSVDNVVSKRQETPPAPGGFTQADLDAAKATQKAADDAALKAATAKAAAAERARILALIGGAS